MVCEACKIEPIEPLHAPAETLTCKRCGGIYVSRGIKDNGYCPNCESTANALQGGILGKHHSGLLEVD